ncbi:MAG: hypothetical protein HOP30_18220 [Cyclobacteriaceae bacterium]|nr:hypothetical protein [Cyclobacteriaceae bacterium]
MKDLTDLANQLVALLREKKFVEAQEQLFSPNAIAQEPEKFKERSVQGKENIILKEKRFLRGIKEWIRFEVSDPTVSKHHFSIRMYTEVEFVNNQKVVLDEIIVYEVLDSFIVKEQFFY